MTIQDILDAIKEVESKPSGRSLELRMSLSKVVHRRLRELGWTQKRLAQESGKAESYISRVLNGNENCSLDRAGELAFALDMELVLAEPKEIVGAEYHVNAREGPGGVWKYIAADGSEPVCYNIIANTEDPPYGKTQSTTTQIEIYG